MYKTTIFGVASHKKYHWCSNTMYSCNYSMYSCNYTMYSCDWRGYNVYIATVADTPYTMLPQVWLHMASQYRAAPQWLCTGNPRVKHCVDQSACTRQENVFFKTSDAASTNMTAATFKSALLWPVFTAPYCPELGCPLLAGKGCPAEGHSGNSPTSSCTATYCSNSPFC